MIWLSSAADRAYAHGCKMRNQHSNSVDARRHRYTADEVAAIELTIGHVHPGNLGVLPPSRETLLDKARYIGLL
jgi:hypothetical protein